MQAGIAFLCGLLFVGIAIFGFIGFLAGGDVFGAVFFSTMFLGSSLIWFGVAAHARGIKLGSLPEAWRAVWGRESGPPD